VSGNTRDAEVKVLGFEQVATIVPFRIGWADAAAGRPFLAGLDKAERANQDWYEYGRLVYAELKGAGRCPPLELPLDRTALRHIGALINRHCPALDALNERLSSGISA
jgi:hypothetical protein